MGKDGDGWPLKRGRNKTNSKNQRSCRKHDEFKRWRFPHQAALVSMLAWPCGRPADRGVGFDLRVSEVLRAAVIKTAAPFEGIELLTSVTPDKFKPD